VATNIPVEKAEVNVTPAALIDEDVMSYVVERVEVTLLALVILTPWVSIAIAITSLSGRYAVE